jgi:polysaccharide biosynthesis transport protein
VATDHLLQSAVQEMPTASSRCATVGLEKFYPQAAQERAELFQEQEIGSLAYYLRILLRAKWVLLLIVALGLLSSFAVTSMLTPVYRSSAILEIESRNEDFLNIKNVSPTLSPARQSPEFNIRTQVVLLQSRPVLDRALEHANIQARLLAPPQPRFKMLPAQKMPAAKQPREAALAILAEGLDVRNESGTRIVEVSFRAPDSRLSADVANALVNAFIEVSIERRWQESQSIGKWLNLQLDDARKNMQSSEEALLRYGSDMNVMSLSENGNPVEERLKNLQLEISKVQAERVVKQIQHELARNAPAESLPEILDDAMLKEYQTQLVNLQRQLAELSATLTREHPRVVKVEAQMATFQSALQKREEAILERIRNDFESIQRRENMLVAEYNSQLKILSGQSDQTSHYLSLKREVDSSRQLYDALFQRVKEAGLAELLRASDISVVESAVAPAAPYRPSMPLNLAFGGLMGLCCGIALAIGRSLGNRRIEEPGDIQGLIKMRELGVIPTIELMPAREPRWRKWMPYGSPEPLFFANEKKVELTTLQENPSPISDSYNSILVSLLLAQKNNPSIQIFAITSSIPGEGKTTLTCNLAIGLARIHKRVLLIDGDMRRPRLHEIFKTDNSKGIVCLLTGGEDSAMVSTDIPGLFLVPCEKSANVQLLFSPKFSDLLRRFRAEFDIILIDCPPLLKMPDARLISRLVDSAILVVAQHTLWDAVLLSINCLMEDGINLLGTVLNNWKPTKSAMTGYYGYTVAPKREAQ